jgi:hypothetical protein
MRCALFLASLHIVSTELLAQDAPLSIAISFTDSATGSIFQSGFSTAFRSLGDVRVVGLNEAPYYVLAGVAVCQPGDCDPISYSLAIRFTEPAGQAIARIATFVAIPPGQITRANPDSVAKEVLKVIGAYEQVRGMWVVNWGRQRYEQAIRELVREIDAGCFDKVRAATRAFQSKESDRFEKYNAYERSRSWLC